MSVAYGRLEFFSLVNHALNLAFGRHAVAQISGFVDIDKFCMKICCHAVAQFLDGVDTRCLKQLGKLSGDAFDSE